MSNFRVVERKTLNLPNKYTLSKLPEETSMAKKAAAVKPPTKSEIMNNLAESTGMTKKEVASFFDALTAEIEKNVGGKGACGQFTIPGLCKIVVRDKPAMPKREVRNPGTGEMVWAKPKPASRVVKIRPLKGLKDMVM